MLMRAEAFPARTPIVAQSLMGSSGWQRSGPGDRRREQGAKAPSRLPEKAIELFDENPYWTVSRLAERLDAAFTTAQRAIDRLVSAGIVTLAREAKRN